MICVAPALPLRCMPMSTKVAAPTATSTWVRRPPPRWRYWRSAPIRVPRMNAAARLTSESRKSPIANECIKAMRTSSGGRVRRTGLSDRLQGCNSGPRFRAVMSCLGWACPGHPWLYVRRRNRGCMVETGHSGSWIRMDAKAQHHKEKHVRVEDNVLVRGLGRYAADAPFPNQAYAFFVRSPHAYAKILSVDIEAALKAPGVVGVLTAKDMEGVGNLGRHPPVPGRRGIRYCRIRRDDAGHRCARSIARRRAANLAAGAGQSRRRLGGAESRRGRQCQKDRRDFRLGKARRAHHIFQPTHGRQLHGASRRHREL